MKILHTADWHLGQRFYDNSRAVEHAHFLNWLIALLHEEQPDVLIVAGDVYDGVNPSAESERLFFEFLERAIDAVEGLQVLITAGNHDGGGRLESAGSLAARQRIFLRGTVRRLPVVEGEVAQPDYNHLLLPLRGRATEQVEALALMVPFLRPGDVGGTEVEHIRQFFAQLHRTADDSRWAHLPRVMVAHLYATGADLSPTDDAKSYIVGGQEQVPAEAMGNTAYTALGHIHKAMPVKRSQAWYAGSPIPLSFAEQGYTHGVNIVTLDAEGKAHVKRAVYEPLRRLCRLPEKGVVTVDALFALANSLPARSEQRDATQWPYLEVCYAEHSTDFDKLRQLRELLATRAVVFCKFTPIGEVQEAVVQERVESIEHFVQMTPTQMLQRIYQKAYGQDLPEALQVRFAEVEATVAEQQNSINQ